MFRICLAASRHSLLERGARRALELADTVATVVERPLADGGPGTLDVFATLPGISRGVLRRTQVTGPLGEAVQACFALLPRRGGPPLAVVESAQACGLNLLSPAHRDPARATTRGVGELVAAALSAGAREVVVGVGGSATNDGGAGAASVLGLSLRDGDGALLPEGGAALSDLARIERTDQNRALAMALNRSRLRIAVDVKNPLLGPSGATAVYGPQKGVGVVLARTLEVGLTLWVERCRADLGVNVEQIVGAGAGGGAGRAGGLRAAQAGCVLPDPGQ